MIGQHPIACSSSRVRRVPQQIRRASSKASITSKIQAPYGGAFARSSTHRIHPRRCAVWRKTAVLSSLMQNQGTLHATDPDPASQTPSIQPATTRHPKRQKRRKLTQLGQASKAPSYDGILVDAPCSNTGVIPGCPTAPEHQKSKPVASSNQPAGKHSTMGSPRRTYGLQHLQPGARRESGATDTFCGTLNWSLATARQLTFQDGVDGAYAALLHRTQ